MNILIITASNNKNLELAHQLNDMARGMGQTTKIIDLVAEELPLYTSTLHSKAGIPDQVKNLVPDFVNAQGMIFIAPEYNGGIPPTLTNILAWLSVNGDDWRACFNGKGAMIATYSGGGGQNVLSAMRAQLS